MTIVFGEQPDVRLSSIRVLDSSGENHTAGPTQAVAGQPAALRVRVGPLGTGVYTVSWRTVSKVDGHLATGSFAFGVGVTPSSAATSGLASKSPRPTTRSIVARWLLYAGLMLLVGSSLVALVGHADLPRRLAGLLGVAVLGAVAGAAAIAWDAASDAKLGIGDLSGTSIARQFVGRAAPVIVAGVLAVGAYGLPLGRRARRWLIGGVGLAGLGAMWGDVAASHAAAARSWRYARMGAQWAHFAAAGVWVGGLVALLVTVGPAVDRPRLVRRFSNAALGAVAVLAASGVQRAYDEVGSVHRLVATGFGQDVIAKSALLAVMVGLGGLNRFRTVPAVARALAPLRRAVRGEVVLAVAVLGVTGALQGLAPPTSLPTPPRPLVLNGADFATTVRVTFSITPATVGFNRFTARVTDYDTGAPVGTGAFLRFALPSRPDLGTSTLTLAPSGPGTYAGTGAGLSLTGTWTVTVVVQEAAGGVEVPFEVTPRTPAERITVEHFAGLPDVFTLALPQDQRLQVYVDPGRPGFNEVHATFIDGPSGQEIPMAGLTMTATPGGPLPVRRLDPAGHFVADLAGAIRGTYRYAITGTTQSGATLSGTFTIPVR